MCGSQVSERRLQACGILNSLRQSEWIGLAEELAELSTADFNRIMEAFRIYREAIQAERSVNLPTRKVRTPESALRPTYPDEKFESALIQMLHDEWPESERLVELGDIARWGYYEQYEPRHAPSSHWSGVPSRQFRRALDFASEQLAKAGYSPE